MTTTNHNTKKPIVIIDIDGTIAKVPAHRARLAEQTPPDWVAFYDDSFDDEAIMPTCDFVRRLTAFYEIMFCTSRKECARRKTQLWLERKLGFTPEDYTLIMRPDSDTRPDYIQKIECFKAETTSEERERVAFVVDDSPTVMLHWRKLGYRTFLFS